MKIKLSNSCPFEIDPIFPYSYMPLPSYPTTTTLPPKPHHCQSTDRGHVTSFFKMTSHPTCLFTSNMLYFQYKGSTSIVHFSESKGKYRRSLLAGHENTSKSGSKNNDFCSKPLQHFETIWCCFSNRHISGLNEKAIFKYITCHRMASMNNDMKFTQVVLLPKCCTLFQVL